MIQNCKSVRLIHPRSARRAFTLVELLVVIGIIALLIGILIPVVSHARQTAWAADTRNSIKNIADACERYHQDNHAYPGPLAWNQIGPTAGQPSFGGVGLTDAATGTAIQNVTSTENMTLGLMGGGYLEVSGTAVTGFKFDANQTKAARGPNALNIFRPSRHDAYLNLPSDNISTGAKQQSWFGDTVIPEPLDRWPVSDQMPILYYRARAGAGTILALNGTPADAQYDLTQNAAYLRAGTDGLTVLGTMTDTAGTGPINGLPYFKHPTLAGTSNVGGVPKQKDGFIIIAAGKDRIFGTLDDITNFGEIGGP